MGLNGWEGRRTDLGVVLLGFGVFPAGVLLLLVWRRRTALLDVCCASKTGGDRARLGHILQIALDIDDLALPFRITMPHHTRLHHSMPLTPLPRRRILTEHHKTQRNSHNHHSRNNKRHAPRLMTRQPTPHQPLVNRRHNKIRHAASQIPQPPGKRIRSAHNILIEKPRRPYLARHKAAT